MYMDNIQIISFKANIDSIGGTLNLIDSIKDDDEIIQLLNADSIVSKDHIIHGVNQAFLAFDRGENLANDISVEIVLRCSAQRQISKAFDMMGLKEGEMNFYAVLINSNDHTHDLVSVCGFELCEFTPDSNHLMNLYKIGESLMSVEDIIIDRITKLAVDY